MYLSSVVKTDNLTNIAWILPILSQNVPNITAGNMSIFSELVKFFKPVNYWEYYYLHDGRLVGKENNVSVIEIKEIDIYDIIIVKTLMILHPV